jgi:hypothetical protein
MTALRPALFLAGVVPVRSVLVNREAGARIEGWMQEIHRERHAEA